MIIMMTIVPVQ